jgi:4-hydroxybenzoate polyprenyltransferase
MPAAESLETTPSRLWARALRLHQWTKNLLVFVPAITSHRLFDTAILARLAALLAILSCCASALYIVNDLLDLEADRRHPRKCRRPLASGSLLKRAAMTAVALLLAVSFGLASLMGPLTLAIAAAYAAGSFSYSYWLKKHMPLDTFALSGLYLLRIVAGGVTGNIHLTVWLLMFSLFFFLSMACCKRVSELVLLRKVELRQVWREGYGETDLEQMNTFGVSAAFTSSVVLALYLNSDQVRLLYRQPLYLWLLVPLFLYWQTRVWTLTWRGQMHDDPVAFAVKDRASYLLGLVTAVVILAAKYDWLGV